MEVQEIKTNEGLVWLGKKPMFADSQIAPTYIAKQYGGIENFQNLENGNTISIDKQSNVFHGSHRFPRGFSWLQMSIN